MSRKQRRRKERLAKKAAMGPRAGGPGATMDVAMEHHRAGRLAQAERIYRRILEAQPEDADALHLLGLIAHQTGKHDVAIDLIGKAIESAPNEAVFHINHGNALLQHGKLDKAIASFRRAIAVDPRHVEAHNNLGIALRDQGKVDEALASFRRAVSTDPNFAMAHLNQGVALRDQGKLDGAVACYRRALEIEPDYVAALANLGAALSEQGKLDEAVASLERAIAIGPADAKAHNNLGVALRDQSKFDQAVASFQRALEIEPDYVEAHTGLSVALRDQGKLDEAMLCNGRALEIDPDHLPARCNHATLHKHSPGDPNIDKLKQQLERDEISNDQRNQLLFALGKVHDDIGAYAEAFSYYRQGNDERAKVMSFDRPSHRRLMEEIKTAFRERQDSVAGQAGHPRHVPIFVLGVTRSGKSLVESLLARHKEVYGAGERREWAEAIRKVLDKYSIPDVFPAFMTALDKKKIAEIGRIYLKNISESAAGCRFYINTSPGHFRLLGLILKVFPSARVIYCHRDPMDNCLFAYFTRHKTNLYSFEFENLASYYADYHGLMAHWRKLYGDRILSIGYEELVRNPTETGARIYQHYGLEFDPAVLGGTFTTHEIGHWRHYEPYLGPLRQALGRLAR